jgi:ATP-dependent Lon protease
LTETYYAGKLPILALRGLVVFPDQTVHFDVGRVKSIKALEACMKQDQHILLIPQKDLVVDDPKLVDLCQVGVIAHVKQVLKTQNENLRVLVTGVHRAKRIRHRPAHDRDPTGDHKPSGFHRQRIRRIGQQALKPKVRPEQRCR